ncbi:unnamed protein product [Phytophthora fragariaefolia]|uniref:Unnamed protein product n=1 Tax=Phytophthora fragariaefolia TaxID=1490495 RepID=A0A9W6WUH7_9STRA|nr:unnamed protein product [Phytophthora fragariaefolia]
MNLSANFEIFDNTERFIVLEMDKYGLILGMLWLEKATESVDPDTGGRRAVRASIDKVLRAAHQVGNLVPPEQGISPREPSLGNIVPRGVGKALIAWEARGTAYNVGTLVPREPVEAKEEGKVEDVASCVDIDTASRVCSRRPVSLEATRSQKAKAPQTWSSDGNYHIIDSETGLRVKADTVQLEVLPEFAELLNLKEM